VSVTSAPTSPQHTSTTSSSSRPASPRSSVPVTVSQHAVHDTVELSLVQAQLAAAQQAAADAQAALTARTTLFASETAALKQQLAATTAAGSTATATSPRHIVKPPSIITGSTAAMTAVPTGSTSGSSSSEVLQLKAQLLATGNTVAVLEQQLSDSKAHIAQLLSAHQVTTVCSCCDTSYHSTLLLASLAVHCP
jgi:hypothetical protein